MQTKVISVTQVNDTYTVVLQQAQHIVTVEGVVFEEGEEEGSKRLDVRTCTQQHLDALFSNWVFEGIQGEGDLDETITLDNCLGFTCSDFTVTQRSNGKLTCF